jgi:hypothetical protein
MTAAEKLRLLAELAETGEEFEICGETYNFIKDMLVFEENACLTASRLELNEVISADITILPFKPKYRDKYYFINSDSPIGYTQSTYNSSLHKLRLSRETVYRTEAEAQEEVRKRGWKV